MELLSLSTGELEEAWEPSELLGVLRSKGLEVLFFTPPLYDTLLGSYSGFSHGYGAVGRHLRLLNRPSL